MRSPADRGRSPARGPRPSSCRDVDGGRRLTDPPFWFEIVSTRVWPESWISVLLECSTTSRQVGQFTSERGVVEREGCRGLRLVGLFHVKHSPFRKRIEQRLPLYPATSDAPASARFWPASVGVDRGIFGRLTIRMSSPTPPMRNLRPREARRCDTPRRRSSCCPFHVKHRPPLAPLAVARVDSDAPWSNRGSATQTGMLESALRGRSGDAPLSPMRQAPPGRSRTAKRATPRGARFPVNDFTAGRPGLILPPP